MSAMNCHMGCVNSTAARFNCPSMLTHQGTARPRVSSPVRNQTPEQRGSSSTEPRLLCRGLASSLPRLRRSLVHKSSCLHAKHGPVHTRVRGSAGLFAFCLRGSGISPVPTILHGQRSLMACSILACFASRSACLSLLVQWFEKTLKQVWHAAREPTGAAK